MENRVSELLKNGDLYNLNVSSTDELFNTLNERLLNKGMVKETFFKAIKEREDMFPTGLENDPYPIALPHVESEHVNVNALIINRISNHVDFQKMDKIDETIPVKVVFLLLITNSKLHVEAIMNLTKLWRDSELMNKLLEVSDKDEFVRLLKEKNI